MSRIPSKILIIKLSALGDIVQALPVLNALKKTWPESSVDWITGEIGAGLLWRHPLLNRVLVYPRTRFGKLARNPFTWPLLSQELIRLKRDLQIGDYDLSIDLQGLFKSGLITFLSGARIRAGFDKGREFSHLFLNRRLPPYDPDKHAVLRYLDIAEAIGAPSKTVSFPLAISETDHEEAFGILHRLSIDPYNFTVLIPGTMWPTKRWRNSSFAELAMLLHEELGIKSVVAGSKSDRDLGREIEELSKKSARDITGQTDLRTLTAIFRLALTAISTDTGPMHLAAAAGLRLVALFGPTAPWRTGPFGKGHVVIRKDMECSPCFKRNCNSRACMEKIKVAEVFNAIKGLCRNRLLEMP